METSNAQSFLFAAAAERGFAASIVAAGRIAEAVEDLERLIKNRDNSWPNEVAHE